MKLFAAVAMLVACTFVTPVVAQTQCGDREKMERRLAEKFGESRRGSGFDGTYVVALWASTDSGSWTILLLRPNGIACIGASGMNWRDDDWKNIIPGDPA